MKSYGFMINLKDDPEVIRKYETYHRAVPEAVIEYARGRGILSSRIFRIGRHLFMVIETTDNFQPSGGLVPRPEDDPQVKEFEALTHSLQERVPEAEAGEWWASMRLVHEF